MRHILCLCAVTCVCHFYSSRPLRKFFHFTGVAMLSVQSKAVSTSTARTALPSTRCVRSRGLTPPHRTLPKHVPHILQAAVVSAKKKKGASQDTHALCSQQHNSSTLIPTCILDDDAQRHPSITFPPLQHTHTPAVALDEDVLRLQVRVDKAQGVQECERPKHLQQQPQQASS